MSTVMNENSLKKNMNHGKNYKKPNRIIANVWNGLGSIDSDLQLRKTTEQDGSKSVVNFMLKVKQQYKARNPETKEQEVKFKFLTFPITAWDSVAEELVSNFKKNDLVKVNGYIRTFQVKTRHAKSVLSFEIVCNKFSSMVRKDKPKDKSFIATKHDRIRTQQN